MYTTTKSDLQLAKVHYEIVGVACLLDVVADAVAVESRHEYIATTLRDAVGRLIDADQVIHELMPDDKWRAAMNERRKELFPNEEAP